MSESTVQKLYLMQVGRAAVPPNGLPFVCYLAQTRDGKNILIDTGLPENMTPPPGMPPLTRDKNVVEQLATLGLQPDDVDILVCTHFDMDHAGCHAAFTKAEVVVQRRHYELAKSGHQRFSGVRSQWDHPDLHYRLVDGDTELVPGLELIETNGHATGHQSVLVRLPEAGPILLTIDAVPQRHLFAPDRTVGPFDENEEETRASTVKLLDLVEREHVNLVIFGHDGLQWQTLKKLPEHYS